MPFPSMRTATGHKKIISSLGLIFWGGVSYILIGGKARFCLHLTSFYLFILQSYTFSINSPNYFGIFSSPTMLIDTIEYG